MVPSSSELIDAVSNPTRRRILHVFVEGAGRGVSAEELATVLEQPIAGVDYHLKTLARCEILRLSSGGGDWTLDVEPDWLGLFLDIWPQTDGGTGQAGEGGAVRGRPSRGRRHR